MPDKVKIPQWTINLIIILLLGAYGFACNSILDRITKNEIRIDNLNPVLLQIQTDISAIKTNTAWLMKDTKK